MREILFRGKSADNGEWWYGSLVYAPRLDNFCSIFPSDAEKWNYNLYTDRETGVIDGATTPVILETVGQYTGLTDCNGKKIFEGDIIKNVAGFIFDGSYAFAVEFIDGGFWGVTSISADIGSTDFMCCEVIGNIHDNPELLEGKSE